MGEILLAHKVVDLVPLEDSLRRPVAEFQENLSAIGINSMQEVVDFAMQLHQAAAFSRTRDSSETSSASQLNIDLVGYDRDDLWVLHKQLQACAVMALGLWQNINFKVSIGPSINYVTNLFDASNEGEYMVFQRSAPGETYLGLYLIYLAQAKQVRDAYSE